MADTDIFPDFKPLPLPALRQVLDGLAEVQPGQMVSIPGAMLREIIMTAMNLTAAAPQPGLGETLAVMAADRGAGHVLAAGGYGMDAGIPTDAPPIAVVPAPNH